MSRLTGLVALCLALGTSVTWAQTTGITAITGADVHTVATEGMLENATILIDNGRISAVGIDIDVPAGAEMIDASGKIITPGLFSPLGQLGLSEVSAVQGSNDATQRGDQFSASFDVADAYNPRSMVIAVSRIDGITRATITPRAAGPDAEGNKSRVLSGLGSVVQLGDSDQHFVKRHAVVVANLGENGSNIAGGSRAAAAMVLRASLSDAINYRDNKAAADRGDWRKYSVSTADLEALQAVLDRSTPLLFNANRASDISVVLDIAAEYEIRAIVAGGAEAWMVADELSAAGVSVILDGINNLPHNFDQINARLDSAGLLVDAGVQVAFEAGSLGPGGQTHNARNITQAAGIAVANGLSWDAALEAITLAPARMYGVDGQVGSIEVGKEADIVIWGADPLEISSYPEQVYIQGLPISMQSRHTLLRDRYLDADSALPPAYRN
jgi:imidazolonepropionase-like amidohydrolase